MHNNLYRLPPYLKLGKKLALPIYLSWIKNDAIIFIDVKILSMSAYSFA